MGSRETGANRYFRLFLSRKDLVAAVRPNDDLSDIWGISFSLAERGGIFQSPSPKGSSLIYPPAVTLRCVSSTGAFHFFARRREVVKYRKKPGERQEHESQEEQTGAE